MTDKANIIFFVTTVNRGGIETYLLRFLQHRGSSFNKIFIFCKGGIGGQLLEQYEFIPNTDLHLKRIGYFNPLDYLYIYRFLTKTNIQAVCDFTGNFAGPILYCAKIAGVQKRIAFYRGSTNHFKETKLRLLYDKLVKMLTYNYATNILANSKAALDFFYPNLWNNDVRFEVIYNGINPKVFQEEEEDLRAEFKIPKKAFVVGHIGRYNAAKNHETILSVARSLCYEYNDIYFLLCGNGVKDNLQQIVDQDKLSNKILLSNNRSDIPKFLNTLDCFYFPSYTEGQPNALIEALISGIPIIASNIEPIKEVIPNNLHHNLIPPNSVEDAISKISLYKTNQLAKKNNALSIYAINKFDYKKRFDEFYKILNS